MQARRLSTAFSIPLFTGIWKPSGFFLEKKPHRTNFKGQHEKQKCFELRKIATGHTTDSNP
jgi:hypothetical protein